MWILCICIKNLIIIIIILPGTTARPKTILVIPELGLEMVTNTVEKHTVKELSSHREDGNTPAVVWDKNGVTLGNGGMAVRRSLDGALQISMMSLKTGK